MPAPDEKENDISMCIRDSCSGRTRGTQREVQENLHPYRPDRRLQRWYRRRSHKAELRQQNARNTDICHLCLLYTSHVSESAVEQTQIVFASHINGAGRLFGGQLMQWIDELAGIVSMRHAGEMCIRDS